MYICSTVICSTVICSTVICSTVANCTSFWRRAAALAACNSVMRLNTLPLHGLLRGWRWWWWEGWAMLTPCCWGCWWRCRSRCCSLWCRRWCIHATSGVHQPGGDRSSLCCWSCWHGWEGHGGVERGRGSGILRVTLVCRQCWGSSRPLEDMECALFIHKIKTYKVLATQVVDKKFGCRNWCSSIWLHQILSDALPGVTVSHPKWPKCNTVATCRG
jgi:hypothetical protein